MAVGSQGRSIFDQTLFFGYLCTAAAATLVIPLPMSTPEADLMLIEAPGELLRDPKDFYGKKKCISKMVLPSWEPFWMSKIFSCCLESDVITVIQDCIEQIIHLFGAWSARAPR